ncbi:tyramine beta-hydroxylase-like [Haliotis rufescens]|uniref:tyramine beta-hydroxylase-like n=1 Tax=Haliotis rufescens TaxID=6454 RepID=UPI00201F08B6|nr:tyramine beta-hydroxylase-like [Haliotis rufescens]
MMAHLRFLMLVIMNSSLTMAYQMFMKRLPNADQVPHPCKLHHTWPGVGHRNPKGGGQRNQFGLDFFAAGQKWTRALCGKDSDGDGRTNGMELGDPTCAWKEGVIPDVTSGITHPGICDPWGGPACSADNAWVSCETEEFNCSATSEPEVQTRTLRFPRMKVPSTETNYFCQTFDLPADRDYHLIATEPTIDNIHVMHHIRLMGCRDGVPEIHHPRQCYMAERGCNDVIGLWTVGLAGQCLYKEAGFRIGASGYKRVLLELHWNNPEMRGDYHDASGLKIYFTPRLRPYDAGILWTGQERLLLPPGESKIVVQSTCPSECTKRYFSNPIYITNSLNHMHYMGISESVEHLRKGKRLQYLTNEAFYTYDNPVINTFDPPLEVRPGDAFKTTCVYRTLSRRVTTMWGEGTNDEMCYSLLMFYPKSAVSNVYCDGWGDYNSCMVDHDGLYRGCHVANFKNQSHPETQKIYHKVLKHCDYKYGECLPECPDVLAEVKQHPCLQGDLGDKMLEEFIEDGGARRMRFATALRSCDCPRLSEYHVGMQDMTSSSGLRLMQSYITVFVLVLNSLTH